MIQSSDFIISKLTNGNYVIEGQGNYQDIDFVNGGYITTEQRANEIRDLMVTQANTPVVIPKSEAELITELQAQNAQMLLALVNGGLM